MITLHYLIRILNKFGFDICIR